MADFCSQCSIELFGEDKGDLREVEESTSTAFLVICEGCGPTAVDGSGKCLGECTKQHENK